jgi:hypothetical protein
MTQRLVGQRCRRWCLLAGAAGPALVFQQGCLFGDPDIGFRAFLLALTEAGVFALDNLLIALR